MSPPDARSTIDPLPLRPGASAKIAGEPDRRRATSVIERAGIVPAAAIPRPGPVPGSAPEPARRRNPLVALLHPSQDQTCEQAIMGMVASGISRALAGSELALILQPLPGDTAAHLRDFLRRYRPAGVVLLPPLSQRDDLAVICSVAQVPCVRIGTAETIAGLACDERAAAAELVAWLVAQGHARIGFVAGPETSPSARHRELGYLDAMADNGLDRGPALIVPGDNSFESGIEAGRLLLEISPRPTAIVASNDEMAVGILHAAAQMGVPVPSQLSVAGLDDTPIAARSLPTLTTMGIPWSRMGEEAARRIAAGDASASAGPTFVADLILRESVQLPLV